MRPLFFVPLFPCFWCSFCSLVRYSALFPGFCFFCVVHLSEWITLLFLFGLAFLKWKPFFCCICVCERGTERRRIVCIVVVGDVGGRQSSNHVYAYICIRIHIRI
ncbi:hypothetical protein B0J11DRAFT_90012 [Dendryphion nanum]|uniref:Uncharacterized protein n=1 Tax=Dendryphion nanum TaxID=256645 RepID=A0A9P9DEK9_9PLEO|nr:hypothetical protein B0J11DRAFT_90012 [Dendryphion nanum]